MLDSLNNVMEKYYTGKSGAIAAFNVANIDMVRAVINAGELEGKPVVVQVFRRLFEDETCEYVAETVKYAARKTSIPVILHLDHGIDISHIKKALELGFTSVMVDGSNLEFNKNISLVLEAKEVINEFKNENKISIEAELGGIPSACGLNSGDNSMFTDPLQVKEFIDRVKVDAIAVSFGSAHGLYIEKPRLDFELLRKITQQTKIPLVLHGGTGLPDRDIKRSVKLGIKKVNIASELQKYYAVRFKEEEMKNERRFIPLDILTRPIREELTDLIRDKIRLINGY